SWSSFYLYSKSTVLQFGARLVTLSAEPTVCFSRKRFAAFCKEMYETKFFLFIRPDSMIKPDV
ncbi:unnamed protein product, partial [Porites evermanni]